MELLTVLVVDDEPGIRSGVLRILKNHKVSYPFMDDDFGFSCLEAESGEVAVTILESKKVDIVLLDNKLPGMNGIEVLEFIKERNIETMVAMITSFASLEIAAKATGDGAYDFIPKPFTPQELKASIDNISKQLYLKRITSKMKQEGKKIRYQFLSLLSHELKAPINAIEGYLTMIKDREMGDDLAAYDQFIDRSLKRISGMRSLIMDLLDFTKIRLERKDDRVEKILLEERVKLAIATVNPMAIQKNINISLQSEEGLSVEADPTDIDIMLNNLMSNAVKYNVENGEVWVELSKGNSQLKISVKDSGIGMTQLEISKLFREFVRIRNRKTQEIAGSGLGLSIVKNLVDLYGGHIEVSSEPDSGSIFSIILPLH